MQQVGAQAASLEDPVGRVPVYTRGFHRGRGHAVPAQPLDEFAEPLHVGAEDSRGGGRRRWVRPAQADAGRDLMLVNVEARGARLDDLQAVNRRRGRVWHVLRSFAGGIGGAFPARSNRLGGGTRFVARLGSSDGEPVQFGARHGGPWVSLNSGERSTDNKYDHAPLPLSGIGSHWERVGVAEPLRCITRGHFLAFGVSASS